MKNDEIKKIMKENYERAVRGATSGESYSIETFERIWKLVNFSDKDILGISWDEMDKEKIEKHLSGLGLEMRYSKSPTLVGFNLEFVPGDTVEGAIHLVKDRIHFSFDFIDRKADNLVEWIEKKYGKSLKLRDDTISEYCYDWLLGNVLITVNLVKFSGLADMTFENIPGYAKMVRGEISMDEFSEKYLKQD